MILNSLQKQQIHEHTIACYPEEMCGVLTEDYFIPITNVADNKRKSFKLAMQEYLNLKKKFDIIAIVHSHCRCADIPEVFDTRTPSMADMDGQKSSGLPWLIVATEGITTTPPVLIPRTPNNKYSGRPFIWFINDCYTLVQDYYLFELGIKLPDAIITKDYQDLRKTANLFDNFITSYGFTELTNVKDIRNGDILLVDNAGSSRNHLVIFHNNRLIHQDMVSCEVPWETFMGRTHKILRYKGENNES